MALHGSRERRTARASLTPERRVDALAAQAAAVALLAQRDLGSAELCQKLCDRGYDARVAGEVIGGLIAGGIVNDQRFAQNYVSRQAERGRGPIRIAAELRARGVAAALIDSALAEVPDWPALAQRTRTARFGARPPRAWPDKARQYRFLQYRGFSSDDIRSATGADPEREEQA